MKNNEITQLLDKYLNGTASPEEVEQVHSIYNKLQQETEWPEEELGQEKYVEQAIFSRINQKLKEENQPAKIFPVKYWMAAASIILLLVITGLVWQHRDSDQTLIISTTGDVNPGKDGAILKLADGTEIVLDDESEGIIAASDEGVMLLAQGQLFYDSENTQYSSESSEGADTDKISAYHTLTTPKGRQFNLQLPDGTRVWLNAASSIRFPAVFSGNERKVEITGEAYFEVATVYASTQTRNQKSDNQDQTVSKIPFKVRTPHQIIEVLGTHFNVNAYDDEDAERTTLLEGSVRVHYLNPAASFENILLKPGQQVAVSSAFDGGRSETLRADLEQVVAWKNGYFQFNAADIYQIMRQISRWYGVEVKFEGQVTKELFKGKVSRSSQLSEVMKVMKANGVNYMIDNDVITIMP
ncbi:MAG TPA: FecR domain-containing protein [Parasegetibacter sp.]